MRFLVVATVFGAVAVVAATVAADAAAAAAGGAAVAARRGGATKADAVPLPRPRPAEAPAAPATPAAAPAAPVEADPAVIEAYAACQERLGALAEADPEPAIIGKAACTVHDLVRLIAVRLPEGGRIPLQGAAKIRCGLAEELAHWIRDDVAPAAAAAGGRMTGLSVDTSYECRPRNRVVGAKISEHGTGNAVDLRGLALADGRAVILTDPTADKSLRTTLMASACRRFTTVLGPGSDGYHESHVHLDLAVRRGGYRMCQWDVRDPAPLPRPRPKQAPQAEPEPDSETDAEAGEEP